MGKLSTSRRALRVRPMERSDFSFIRKLASTIPNYTVPPLYILWMFSTFQKRLCAVAHCVGHGDVGYLLGMRGEVRSGAMFVWQFACTFEGQRLRAPELLAKHLKKYAQRNG